MGGNAWERYNDWCPDMTTPPRGCGPPDFADTDLNADGDVDLSDFAVLQSAFTSSGG